MWSAAFRRTGVLRVDSIAGLFYMAGNGAMQRVCRRQGFQIIPSQEVGENVVKAVKVL